MFSVNGKTRPTLDFKNDRRSIASRDDRGQFTLLKSREEQNIGKWFQTLDNRQKRNKVEPTTTPVTDCLNADSRPSMEQKESHGLAELGRQRSTFRETKAARM